MKQQHDRLGRTAGLHKEKRQIVRRISWNEDRGQMLHERQNVHRHLNNLHLHRLSAGVHWQQKDTTCGQLRHRRHRHRLHRNKHSFPV